MVGIWNFIGDWLGRGIYGTEKSEKIEKRSRKVEPYYNVKFFLLSLLKLT